MQAMKSEKLLVVPYDRKIPKIRISTGQAEELRDHRQELVTLDFICAVMEIVLAGFLFRSTLGQKTLTIPMATFCAALVVLEIWKLKHK